MKDIISQDKLEETMILKTLIMQHKTDATTTKKRL